MDQDDNRLASGEPRVDRLVLYDRWRRSIDLGGLYEGGGVFLCLSGPSLASEELWRLDQRGLAIAAVNNAPVVVRPHLWISLDPPHSFHEAIWRDPAILKLTPLWHTTSRLRGWRGTNLEKLDLTAGDCANTLFYRRDSRFDPHHFLYRDTVSVGGEEDYVDPLGIRGKRTVLLAALRLLVYLGFKRIYLLGADFGMELGAANYAFEMETTPAAVRHNNAQYAALNRRLDAVQPHLAAHGVKVWNCTGGSGLRTFPFKTLAEATDAELALFPRSLDTAGYYDPPAKEGADAVDYAALYDGLYRGGYHADLNSTFADRWLLPLVEASQAEWKVETALDVGCAQGGAVERLARLGVRAAGVDASAVAVEAGRAAGRDLHVGSATALAFNDRSYDLVLSTDTLEHLHPADVPKAVREMIRVCKRFLAIRACPGPDRAAWKDKAGVPLHLSVYPRQAWMALFETLAAEAGRRPKLVVAREDGPEFVMMLEA
ncbi:MAG: class I SAM-dependent methyltransferase [Phycisphaeraceae bacterium]|nr:class I SAM-dependent methyltransferase [Phycisphaeraceae bacterium]